MDDAGRIPIDIGYEEAAPQPADPRVTVREDGTVAIDILVAQRCEPEPTTEGEIVVCAAGPGGGQAPLARPVTPNLNEKINAALGAKVGPVELGSIRQRDGTYAFGARIRF